jgi:hypothetical protein
MHSNCVLFISASFAVLLNSVTTTNVKFLIGQPEVSHSGPTNALYGHEQFVDDDAELHRNKRAPYFNNYRNTWNEMLISSEPPTDFHKMWIASEHNRYRRMVPATNMRMLYWSEELAASAQRHANRCDFRHSRDRVNVGENIWAAPYANYSDAITRWFEEVNNPWCGCNHAYKHCCGHYIQVVWAQTNLVGCGFARCADVWGVTGRGHRNVFVCHYNPQGNTVYVTGHGLYAVPAFVWAANDSQRCRDCPSDAPACHEGLCYMPKTRQMEEFQSTSTTDSAISTKSILKGKPQKSHDNAVEQNELGTR